MTKKQAYDNKKYPELLQDEKFLQWRFFPDNETDSYWIRQQESYPDLKKDITLADSYLKKHTFKKGTLSSEDREMLLEKLRTSLRQKKKNVAFPSWIKYAAVACLALAIGALAFLSEIRTQHPQEAITGSLLESQEIQLITSTETKSFKENISIKIEADGIAKIRETNQTEADIHIAQNTMNKLIVPYGKRSSIELSDGSKVWLNSGSVLEFPSQFAGKKREIRLASGEMYIEVAEDKNHSFHVQTSNFGVQVVGTAFNVSVYEELSQSVTLVKGKVKLQSNDNQEIDLLPNQMVIYTASGNFKKQIVDVNKYISWKNGYIIFDETPVSEILKYVERYYNLSFNYDKDTNLRNITCKGKLYLSENVDNVMNSIALLSSTRYKRENNTIYITNNPLK